MRALISMSLLGLPVFAGAQEVDPGDLFRVERNPIRAVFMMVYHASQAVDRANATLAEVAAGVAEVNEKVDALAPAPGPIARCSAPEERSSSMLVNLCQGGHCQEISLPCYPYACNPLINTCNSRCSSSRDCHAGAECDSAAEQCVPVINTCADSYSVRQANGSIVSCSGYRCVAGACFLACEADNDCQTGLNYRCEAGRCVR